MVSLTTWGERGAWEEGGGVGGVETEVEGGAGGEVSREVDAGSPTPRDGGRWGEVGRRSILILKHLTKLCFLWTDYESNSSSEVLQLICGQNSQKAEN